MLLVTRSVSDSVSNGAASSGKRLPVVTIVPSRSGWSSSLSKLVVDADMPNEARPCPGVKARSTKKPPKVSVARSTVPSSGFKR